MSKKQMGFTLIEIVMVLVLLGILSAVAVPKYFDLRDKAEENAMAAIAAEYQSRLNAAFAGSLLDGKDCKTAVAAGITEANLMAPSSSTTDSSTTDDTVANKTQFKVTALTDKETKKDGKYNTTAKLTIKSTNSSTGKQFNIALPTCNK